MAFCTNCGSNIAAGAVFCTNCGKAVNGTTPQTLPAEPQNQYIAPQQSPPPVVKKAKSKAPVIIAIIAAVVVVIVVIVIISNRNTSYIPPWEGYDTFEDFARAAEIDDILSMGELDELKLYALIGGAFAGSILAPVINPFLGAFDIHVTVTAKVDLVSGSKLTKKYNVPPELRQNYDYLIRRSGVEGSKTYLALHFDGQRVFDTFIPYNGWVVMTYEEGSFITF